MDTLIKNDTELEKIEEIKKIAFKIVDINRQALLDRFTGYINGIKKNSNYFMSARKSFHRWKPFTFYLTTTNAKKVTNRLNLSVRYLGQEVAILSCGFNGEAPQLDTSDFNEKNKRDFNCDIIVQNENWKTSKAAKDFRRYFSSYPKRNTVKKENEEHRIESLLLSEFSKKTSEGKKLKWIQPTMIDDYFRYPMPTGISASKHDDLHYNSQGGSNIDLLVRTGKGRSTKLCIIELKDKNTKKEPPAVAIEQALAYTVFIHELLRSDIGEKWWKLFGFTGEIPSELILYAACAMPSNDNNDYSFAGKELSIGNDKIKLHYLYFKEENNEIKEIDASWTKKLK